MLATASNIPDVLFLKDVHLNDAPIYVEETYDDNTYISYASLPEYYISLEQWPTHTNLQCCSCDLAFRGIPWFIALGKTTIKTQKAMLVYKVFCTPFCTMWYINNVKDHRLINKWDIIEMLHEFCSGVLGKRVEYIPEAQSKYNMIQYVGSDGITAQEFRDQLDRLWDKIIFKNVSNKLF